jgi:hypothetical protein
MKHPLRVLFAAMGLSALLSATFAASGLANRSGNPFYLVPEQERKECHSVNNCVSLIGPWVVVPARGQATYLLECPAKQHAGFVGGTDTRTSSPAVRVWFDGQIGSPIKQNITTGAALLFHAVTTNGKAGTFEPVIGCVRLRNQSPGRSTVSARHAAAAPGTAAGPPLDFSARLLVLVPGTKQTKITSCAKGAKLVDSWKALAFSAENPPSLAHVSDVSIDTVVTGNRVRATVETAPSLPFAPLAEVQIGAICTR